MSGTIELARVQAAGRFAFAGFTLRTLARTESTQDIVRAATRRGADAGFCCVADEQSAGRGRQGRVWTAPPRTALLCSTLVGLPAAVIGGASLAAGLAVRDAVAAAGASGARLKWPNDVLAEGGKLAGVLCEVEPRASLGEVAVVIGVGVNLRTEAVPPGIRATSMAALCDAPPSALGLLAQLLPALGTWLGRLAAGGVPAIRAEWLRHAVGIGEEVTARGARGSVAGVAEGIDDDGALLIRTSRGDRVRVIAADVHLGIGPAESGA